MEELEEDLKSRKRRRRSIRNIRRQPGILPISLSEEPAEPEQSELNGNKAKSEEDSYGSLWMETEEPMKVKKRRRSSLLAGLPSNKNTSRENMGDASIAGGDLKSSENNPVLEHHLTEPEPTNNGHELIMDSGEYKAISDNMVSKEYENDAGTRDLEVALKTKKEQEVILPDSRKGTASKLLIPKIDQEQKEDSEGTAEYTSNSEDEFIVNTPQSMSPEYPMSPSVLLSGDCDNNGCSYFSEDKNVEKISEHEKGHKFEVNEKIEINSKGKLGEERPIAFQADTDKICGIELSEHSFRLETSTGQQENNELSLSDKENTMVEDKSLIQEDSNSSTNSPGSMSSCKAFAGKVADSVKSSLSYPTNILQASRPADAESPFQKLYPLKNKQLLPEPLVSLCSDVKLTSASDRSLEMMVDSTNQVLQVYSVTETSKEESACEKVDTDKVYQTKSDGRSELRDEIDQIKCVRSNGSDLPRDSSEIVREKRQKIRKSTSKIFHDTFNAVTNALNKAVGMGVAEKCCETTDPENLNNYKRKQDRDQILSGSADLAEKNSLLLSEGIDQVHTSEDNNSITEEIGDNIFKPFSEIRSVSSDNLESSKHRKRRSVDFQCSADEFENNNDNSVITETKRKKSLYRDMSEISDTDIADRKSSVASDSTEQVHQELCPAHTVEVSVSESTHCNDIKTVNQTESTISVIDGFSKLELQVSLPEPVHLQKEPVSRKKDRRRRRSNNFYFASVSDDTEELLNGNNEEAILQANSGSKDPSQTKLVDSGPSKSNMIDSAELSIDNHKHQIHAVIEEISQVRINDNDIPENLQINSDNKESEMIHNTYPEKEKRFYGKAESSTRDDNEKENLTDSDPSEVDEKSQNKMTEETANVNIENLLLPTDQEPAPKRKRRRSADAAALKLQMCANDVDIAVVDEKNTGPITPVRQNRKRKKSPEVQLEDIYRNKNYKKPEQKTWETIFESPKAVEQIFSKRRLHTILDFEKLTQAKLKRRSQRAIKNGWDPKKRRKKVLSDDQVQMKLSAVFSDLDQLEEESISDKIKKTMEY